MIFKNCKKCVFFPANWNNWWNLFKQYSIFSLFLFLKAFSDLKYEIDINVKKFENWLISILLLKVTELHNFTADYQIKIARVPLWIGHCHLCIMVYWKLRFQSLTRVSNNSPSTNSPSTHSPSTHPPSTHSPSTHSPLHIRLELIRLVLIRSTHSPNTHSLSTHSPNTHSQY